MGDGSVDMESSIKWTKFTEDMLARWCDQAKCFEWMHTEAFSTCDMKSRLIIISSNILTAVSGITNVIAGGSSVGGVSLAYVFGSLSILVSITNMLQEKLGYGTAAIEHRQYATMWGIIRRKIEEEVSVAPEARIECGTFLKMVRQDINKVSMDGSTKIPKYIRNLCYKKFSQIIDFDIPDICGGMEHTKVFARETESINSPLLQPKPPKIEGGFASLA